MKETKVQKWFHELQRIWQEKDIIALKNILSKQFEYYEDPFESPITTWEELEDVWQEVNDQKIQTLEINTLIDGEVEGFAHYTLSFSDLQGVEHQSRGAYYLKLDENGKATEFRQWWTVKKF
jgi:hypothetical protein